MVFRVHTRFVDTWTLRWGESANPILGAYRLETLATIFNAFGVCTISVNFAKTLIELILNCGVCRACFALTERIYIRLGSLRSDDCLAIRVITALIRARHLGTTRISVFTASAMVGHTKRMVECISCAELEGTGFEGTSVCGISANVDIVSAVLGVRKADDIWSLDRFGVGKRNRADSLFSAFAWAWELLLLGLLILLLKK
mmetsp:Transcript_22095/g.52301  ORF Transcript_22095/g.52301 Transcript_22095/m.52301 type:complete len:201 (-) Transcript_22095:351-953(-)